MEWFWRATAHDIVDCENLMNTGDLLVCGNDAAIVYRDPQYGVLVFTNTFKMLKLDEFVTHNGLSYVRYITFEEPEASVQFIADFKQYIEYVQKTYVNDCSALVEALRVAGGTCKIPRKKEYTEHEHNIMCRVSPAYYIVHAYTSIGVCKCIKSQNLYDCEDLQLHGDLDESLYSGIRFERPVYIRP